MKRLDSIVQTGRRIVTKALGPRNQSLNRCPGCGRTVSAAGDVCNSCTNVPEQNWGG